MVPSPYQATILSPPTTIGNVDGTGKPRRRTQILYRSANRQSGGQRTNLQFFLSDLGGSSGNPGMPPLVCRSPTSNRLETGMDRPHSTAHNIKSTKRRSGQIYFSKQKLPKARPTPSTIPHREGHHPTGEPSLQQPARNDDYTFSPPGVPMTLRRGIWQRNNHNASPSILFGTMQSNFSPTHPPLLPAQLLPLN